MAILLRQLLGPSAITRRVGLSDTRQDGAPTWSGSTLYLQSAVTVVPEDGSGAIPLAAFTAATAYPGETINRIASHFVSFIDKATDTFYICQQEHWATISTAIDVYPLWYHTARNSVPYQPRSVAAPVPSVAVLALFASYGVLTSYGEFSLTNISGEVSPTGLPSTGWPIAYGGGGLAVGDDGSIMYNGFLFTALPLSGATLVVPADGLTNSDPTKTLYSAIVAVAHWSGTWTALVQTQLADNTTHVVSSQALTVQTSTVADPTHRTDWTVVRTITSPGLILGITAGGGLLAATADFSASWAIIDDSGSSHSIGTTVIDYCNLHAYVPGSGVDEYAPQYFPLPIRFDGPPGSPIWAGQAVIWQTGHVDVGYQGCCGDGGTGAYAVTLAGDVIHWASPGASPTTIRSAAIPSQTATYDTYSGYTYSGESVQLMQIDRHDSTQLVIYHGNSNVVTPTTVKISGGAKTDGATFDWYTDTYVRYVIVTHVDDPYVTFTDAFSVIAAR